MHKKIKAHERLTEWRQLAYSKENSQSFFFQDEFFCSEIEPASLFCAWSC